MKSILKTHSIASLAPPYKKLLSLDVSTPERITKRPDFKPRLTQRELEAEPSLFKVIKSYCPLVKHSSQCIEPSPGPFRLPNNKRIRIRKDTKVKKRPVAADLLEKSPVRNIIKKLNTLSLISPYHIK